MAPALVTKHTARGTCAVPLTMIGCRRARLNITHPDYKKFPGARKLTPFTVRLLA